MNNIWNSIKNWWNGLWGKNDPEEPQDVVVQATGEVSSDENGDCTISIKTGSVIDEDTIRLR